MSVRATRWAMDTLAGDSTIPRRCRTLLLAIAGHADANTAECFPSIETLAAIAGNCRENTWRALQELIGRGLVDVHERPGRSHRYRLPVPVPLSTTPRDIARGQQPEPRAISSRNPARFRREPRAITRDEGLEGCVEEPHRPHTADELDRMRQIAAAAKRVGQAEIGVVNL